MTASSSHREGPIDDNDWPTSFVSRVLSPDGGRVHGYDLESDVARNYTHPELILLALTGEPPDAVSGAGLDKILTFLSVAPPLDAPCHAAGLSRLTGARPAATLITASIGLSEAARSLLEEHQALLGWLDDPSGPFPRAAQGVTGEDRASVSRLEVALRPTGLSVPALRHEPTRDQALLASLHACGLRRAEQLLAVLVIAALPTVFAEALAVPPMRLDTYPLKFPEIRYIEDEADER